MKIIFRRWYLSGLLLLGILVYSVSMTGFAKDGVDKNKTVAEELTEEEDKLRYMEQSTRAKHGRFILQGEVVDENGMRLNGVTLELEKVKLKNFGFESETEEETLTINGTFQLDLKGYAAVRLYFSKDGYYSEKTHFPVTEMEVPEEIEEKIAEGKKVSEREFDKIIFKKEDIRIVLERQGKITHLIEYSDSRGYAALEYIVNGKGTVIDFDRRHYKSLVTVENLNDQKQLPENCVYMIADKEPDGGIITVQKFRTRKDTWGKVWQEEYIVPQRVKLVMTDPDSGFIKFEPDPNKKMSRQMKEAPESGYQREFVIEADVLKKDDVSGGWVGIPFYFKVKDKYGKGGASLVEISEDRTTLKLSVGFGIQPDGSLNLETGD